eukprot:TRINITY_DN92203_c0_g1_i1.p1 TRINITY_DN92203_c0_g1~~TRINITY_DN92203_c0_g1_i1.p1  ORF type:complete len:469 (+),score=74.43 TRINITY_DN92203_c0_g1_i1:126-1532(+)
MVSESRLDSSIGGIVQGRLRPQARGGFAAAATTTAVSDILKDGAATGTLTSTGTRLRQGRSGSRGRRNPRQHPPRRKECDSPGDDDVKAEPEVMLKMRSSLADARELHRSGKDEEALEKLAPWLEKLERETTEAARTTPHGKQRSPVAAEASVLTVQQAMLALGCWLCNACATRHLQAGRVARAFGFTHLCERWLDLRKPELGGKALGDQSGEDMWLRLLYDCSLNSADLAQASEDVQATTAALRTCEKLLGLATDLPDPEAVHMHLAEALMQEGDFAEAAMSARRAHEVLSVQALQADCADDEDSLRRVCSILYALSLEQMALSNTSGPGLPPPSRSLKCFLEAERIWFQRTDGAPKADGNSQSGAEAAASSLLARMRQTHLELFARVRCPGSPAGAAPMSPMRPRPQSSGGISPVGKSALPPVRPRTATGIGTRSPSASSFYSTVPLSPAVSLKKSRSSPSVARTL